MNTHTLKIDPDYWEDIANGKKTFEVRVNDRDYRVGDNLALRKFSRTTNVYIERNRVLICNVTYIEDLARIGLEGYVGMQIKVNGILKVVDNK